MKVFDNFVLQNIVLLFFMGTKYIYIVYILINREKEIFILAGAILKVMCLFSAICLNRFNSGQTIISAKTNEKTDLKYVNVKPPLIRYNKWRSKTQVTS